MDRFKYFLINEEKSFLGRRVGDVLTSMQDVQNDMENMGTRHLARLAEEIVNQIRKILHSNWTTKSKKHLEELQKVGVAIQKAIDEKGDLRQLLPTAVQSLQDLSGKLGTKVNDLSAPEMDMGEPVSQDQFQMTGNGPAPKQPQGQPGQQGGQPPQGGPQGPPQGGMGAPPPQGGGAPPMPGM